MSLLSGMFSPLGQLVDAAQTVANGILDVIADAIGTAVEAATAGIGTAWIRINTPSLASVDGKPSPVVQALQADLRWVIASLLMFAIVVEGARIAIHGKPERFADVIRGVAVTVLALTAGAAAVQLVVDLSDALGQTIIDHALAGNSFGKHVAAMLAPSGAGAVVGVIVLGLVAFLSALVQIALLAFRAGALVILTVLLPVAFALYGTEWGREWSKRLTTWVLAFALYKPVAALVYAASFRLIDEGEISADGIVKAVVGTMLMIVAILALPALLKLLAPVVQHVHVKSGGGAGGALVAAAAMPTGARFVAGGAQTMRELGAHAIPTGAVNAPAPPTGNGSGPAPTSTNTQGA